MTVNVYSHYTTPLNVTLRRTRTSSGQKEDVDNSQPDNQYETIGVNLETMSDEGKLLSPLGVWYNLKLPKWVSSSL